MIEELPLFPGVLTFLKAASREFELGLVSMANKTEVGYVFQRANLDATLFGDCDGRRCVGVQARA